MTVYVIQQPSENKKGWTPDLSSAAEYGPIVYIFDSHKRVYSLPTPSRREAREVLRDFDPEKDYVLWPGIGDPAALFAAINAIRDNGHEEMTILYWSRKRANDGSRDKTSGFYVPCKFNK